MLLPAEREEWFSDALSFSSDTKVKSEALQGRVIVEAAEMAGASKADIEAMKSFLSRTDDGGVRRAYRRDPEPSPRRCVIVGTADREQPLPNDSNLRRFVPIYLNSAGNQTMAADVRAILNDEREQLWAEALAMYRDGQEARLPDELKTLQAVATDAARAPDQIIEDAVTTWAEGRDGFTLAQCAAGVGMADSPEKATRLHMGDQLRLGRVLTGLGFTKRQARLDGKPSMRWYRSD